MVGGALMVVIGVLYLVLEDFVLADFTWSNERSSPRNHFSRTLVGIQIGLTLLSMVITRSSALSLQAKQGLPRGNQIMGWVVLGKLRIL
jgi:phosphatidylinositol glycan class N